MWQSLLSFKPESSDFDLLDKIGPSYKGVKDENKTYHDALWYWVKVIHKKQEIWNWKFFQMKIWRFSSKYEVQEKLLNDYERELIEAKNDLKITSDNSSDDWEKLSSGEKSPKKQQSKAADEVSNADSRSRTAMIWQLQELTRNVPTTYFQEEDWVQPWTF